MEVAGLTLSAIAIATLFKTCVDCFETFSQGKDVHRDLSHLLIRLDFEKVQMLLWGKSSGILNIESSERHARLSDPDVCRLVEDALTAIQGFSLMLASCDNVTGSKSAQQLQEINSQH